MWLQCKTQINGSFKPLSFGGNSLHTIVTDPGVKAVVSCFSPHAELGRNS